jgi:hypothetical protein
VRGRRSHIGVERGDGEHSVAHALDLAAMDEFGQVLPAEPECAELGSARDASELPDGVCG